jgi:hypothetical protein
LGNPASWARYPGAVSIRQALITAALSLACTPALAPSSPTPQPQSRPVIVEDPDPPSGEIAGFTSTSLGRGLGRIALPKPFHPRLGDGELYWSMTFGEMTYSIRLALPGETKPEPGRACDELFAHSEIETDFRFEVERREDFRVGPHGACEVEGVGRGGHTGGGPRRSAFRFIAADAWTIQLSVGVAVDAIGTAPSNWDPKPWFDTLELPDSLPDDYPNPDCEIHIDDGELSPAEQAEIEAELSRDVATLPRPVDVVELHFTRVAPSGVLGLMGLGGMTESELRPLLAELEARVADRALPVRAFGCGGLDRPK